MAGSWLPSVRAEEASPAELVQQVIAAAGGQDRLLTLFRMRERLVVGADLTKPGQERVSVLQPPKSWWVGKKERVGEEKEPAIQLVWAWTLGALVDPETKVEPAADVVLDGQMAFGLRLSGTIDPPMLLYFGRDTKRLLQIDWRNSTHDFSEWKKLDGLWYPSKSVGIRTATGREWYRSEILEIERLLELPAELQPASR